MKLHYLQHVAYEGIGSIQEWAETRGHALVGTLMFAEQAGVQTGAQSLPHPDDVDLLVVMGGPMNVYESAEYPWLLAEKEFIRACVDGGKAVLGICLGAQLIADVLGGRVTPAPSQEIGWYPVDLTESGRGLEAFAHFPGSVTVLHWHGDTFSIPDGAVHAATSVACPHQAFALDGARVVGLQFHLEETPESLAELVEAAGRSLPDGPWTSGRAGLLAPDAPFAECRRLLFGLLDRMAME
jgi:GMP synthase-like glutamine amidotransferase